MDPPPFNWFNKILTCHFKLLALLAFRHHQGFSPGGHVEADSAVTISAQADSLITINTLTLYPGVSAVVKGDEMAFVFLFLTPYQVISPAP